MPQYAAVAYYAGILCRHPISSPTNHPQHAATCCPNTSGQSASIEPVAAPQVVVCRPNAVAAQPSRCRPERPHQCDRSALPVQFSPRVSCRHKAYTTISLSPSLVFLAVPVQMWISSTPMKWHSAYRHWDSKRRVRRANYASKH